MGRSGNCGDTVGRKSSTSHGGQRCSRGPCNPPSAHTATRLDPPQRRETRSRSSHTAAEWARPHGGCTLVRWLSPTPGLGPLPTDLSHAVPACERKPDHPWSRMKPIRGFLVQVSKCRTVIEATALTKRVPIRARPRILDFRRAPKAWCEQLPQRTGLQSAPGIEASITPDDIIAQSTAPAGRTRPRPAPTETSRKAGSSGAPAAPLRIGS